MRINKKLDEFTPWQTQEEVMFASAIGNQVGENQNSLKDAEEIVQKPVKKPEFKPRSRLTSVYSIIRLKTQKNQDQSEQKLSLRKRKDPSSPYREVKPMNTNLISIINTYKETNTKVNPETNTKKPYGRKFLKQHSKIQKITRNFTPETPQIPHHPKIDIKKLKQSLFQKKNPSLQTLFKARQQLQKMQGLRQSPILRTYSVQNIKLNAAEQKNKTLEKFCNLSGRKDSNQQFNSTMTKLKPLNTKTPEICEIRPRLKSCVNLDAKKHIIDRLYDKFC